MVHDSSAALDPVRMAQLLEVGRSAASHRDVDALLRDILEAAREMAGARYAAIGVLSADRRRLARFLTSGMEDHPTDAFGDPSHERGVIGTLLRDPRPLRVDDLTAHPDAVGTPEGHPRMSTFLGAPIMVGGHAWGNFYLANKAGGPFDAADEVALTVLSEWAAAAIENAALYRRLTRRSAELERVTQALRTSSRVARSIGGEADLAVVLRMITECARSLLRARSVTAVLSDRQDDGGALRMVACAGDRDDTIPDLARAALDGDGCLHVAPSVFVAPMRFRGRFLGAVAARLPDGAADRLGDDLEQFLLSFAATAATAVATARSAEVDRLRQAMEAAEAERRRWGRELHDETLQALAGLRVLLTSALRAGSPEQLRAAVEEVVEQLTTETATLRLLITELRPAALDELGLEPAIDNLVARIRAVEGLVVATAIDLGGGRLDPELETTTYRVVQEALTNIAKHADAVHVDVAVWREREMLMIEIRDDGVGFDPAAVHEGFGLTGMRERVHLAGGTFGIASDDDGTVVRARIPVPAGDAPTAGTAHLF